MTNRTGRRIELVVDLQQLTDEDLTDTAIVDAVSQHLTRHRMIWAGPPDQQTAIRILLVRTARLVEQVPR